MAIPHAEGLIQRAKNGERLNSKERRYALSFLMATSQEESTEQLATLFQVSGRLIREDKKNIREERAKSIKEDDIGLVIADIAMTLDKQMCDLERSKGKCVPGSIAYMRHCTAIHEMQLKTVSALQDLGYYPKNLGLMTVEKWDYSAIIGKDNTVITRPTATFDAEVLPILEGEFEQVGDVKQIEAAAIPLEEPAELKEMVNN